MDKKRKRLSDVSIDFHPECTHFCGFRVTAAVLWSGGDQGWADLDGLAGEHRSEADEVIDAEGCALLPGFVNTHAHSHSSLTRGSAEGVALDEWLKVMSPNNRG